MTLPLVTALVAAGVSAAGLLLAVSAAAGFVAHEPAAILLGQRGARAGRQRPVPATRWLVLSAGIGVIAGAVAVLTIDRHVRWSIVVPLIPAILLGVATMLGREKSWYGEVAAALAFAGLAVPVAMAAGSSLRTAAAIAIPFALLFIASTLAVRTVILRVRGGGNAPATTATRRSAFAVSGVGTAALTWFVAAGTLPAAALAAALPGLVISLVSAARPPQPTRLRTIGWALVAVSMLTAVIVVATV